MASILGGKIKRHREALGLKLEELADRIGSTKSYVWELENKEGVRPSAEKVFRLAEALDVTAEYLMDDAQREPKPKQDDVVLFRKLQKLPARDKEILKRFIDSLSEDK
jgi:transcriptional regulator with XRE-family HTH domain